MNIDVISLNTLVWMNKSYSCVLGQRGVKLDKLEGDCATPVGNWPLLYVLYRPDRITKPTTGLPVKALNPSDGWCDDPSHPSYNKFIKKPFRASHETLWRIDKIYDLIVVLGYNSNPIVPGWGSAIFLHLTGPEFTPTRGCVALELDNLSEILVSCSRQTKLIIHPQQ